MITIFITILVSTITLTDDVLFWLPLGINLLQAIVYEIGHSLGLDHTTVGEVVMFPSYRSYKGTLQLHEDNVMAIQKLYGT